MYKSFINWVKANEPLFTTLCIVMYIIVGTFTYAYRLQRPTVNERRVEHGSMFCAGVAGFTWPLYFLYCTAEHITKPSENNSNLKEEEKVAQ